MDQEESVENIFSDSFKLLVGQDPSEITDDAPLVFGPLSLTVAPKVLYTRTGSPPRPIKSLRLTFTSLQEGKANTLLADHIFSPAFLLAERIERGLINLSPHAPSLVVELGAGTGLPSLLASTLPSPPALVVVTDYPDDLILKNLQSNVDRNSGSLSPHCTVECRGYEWGKDPNHLLRLLSSQGRQRPFEGYDAVILSDLLHFDRSHGELLDNKARAYVAAGVYTKSDVCTAFLRHAERRGLVWIDRGAGQDGREVDEVWRGALPVQGMSRDQLGARKVMCRWWVARWSDEQL